MTPGHARHGILAEAAAVVADAQINRAAFLVGQLKGDARLRARVLQSVRQRLARDAKQFALDLG